MALNPTYGNLFSPGNGLGIESYSGTLYTPNYEAQETGYGEPLPTRASNFGSLSGIAGDVARAAGDLWLYGQKRKVDAEYATPIQVNFDKPLTQTESGPRVEGQTFAGIRGVGGQTVLALAAAAGLAFVGYKAIS